MADKLMYILNNDKQNYPRLKLVVETFEHSTQDPKVDNPTN